MTASDHTTSDQHRRWRPYTNKAAEDIPAYGVFTIDPNNANLGTGTDKVRRLEPWTLDGDELHLNGYLPTEFTEAHQNAGMLYVNSPALCVKKEGGRCTNDWPAQVLYNKAAGDIFTGQACGPVKDHFWVDRTGDAFTCIGTQPGPKENAPPLKLVRKNPKSSVAEDLKLIWVVPNTASDQMEASVRYGIDAGFDHSDGQVLMGSQALASYLYASAIWDTSVSESTDFQPVTLYKAENTTVAVPNTFNQNPYIAKVNAAGIWHGHIHLTGFGPSTVATPDNLNALLGINLTVMDGPIINPKNPASNETLVKAAGHFSINPYGDYDVGLHLGRYNLVVPFRLELRKGNLVVPRISWAGTGGVTFAHATMYLWRARGHSYGTWIGNA